jgi:hypothetical protein
MKLFIIFLIKELPLRILNFVCICVHLFSICREVVENCNADMRLCVTFLQDVAQSAQPMPAAQFSLASSMFAPTHPTMVDEPMISTFDGLTVAEASEDEGKEGVSDDVVVSTSEIEPTKQQAIDQEIASSCVHQQADLHNQHNLHDASGPDEDDLILVANTISHALLSSALATNSRTLESFILIEERVGSTVETIITPAVPVATTQSAEHDNGSPTTPTHVEMPVLVHTPPNVLVSISAMDSICEYLSPRDDTDNVGTDGTDDEIEFVQAVAPLAGPVDEWCSIPREESSQDDEFLPSLVFDEATLEFSVAPIGSGIIGTEADETLDEQDEWVHWSARDDSSSADDAPPMDLA